MKIPGQISVAINSLVNPSHPVGPCLARNLAIWPLVVEFIILLWYFQHSYLADKNGGIVAFPI